MIFVLLFGAAFGSFTGGNTTYKIAVINLDEGVELNGTTLNHGDNFVEILNEMKFQDSDGKNTSTNVFDLKTDLTEAEAQELVEDQDLTAYIVIPENFSAAVFAESMRYVQSAISAGIQSQFDGSSGELNLSDPLVKEALILQLISDLGGGSGQASIPAHDEDAIAVIEIQGDPGSQSYFTVSGIVEGVVRGYIEESGLRSLDEASAYLSFDIDPSTQEPHVMIENKAYEVSEFSVFDYQVPGIIVFALLMGAMTVVIFMAREESKGTLARLKITKMSSFDLLFGTTAVFLIIAVAQLLILLGVALGMGFHYHPDANLGLALLIAIIGAIASVALGLILAAVVKDEDQAGSLGPAVVVPMSFLTGAFFELPSVVLSNNFLGTGKTFELFDWLPWTQCSKGLSKVLIYGASFEEVALEIGLLIAFTTILFIIGVMLYHKNRLRAI